MKKTKTTRPGSSGSPEKPEASNSGFWFDDYAADTAVEFFTKYLRHSKGEWAGKPLSLEKWQAELIRNIFGWKRPDGTRKYRKVYVEIPRKNGKSTIAAGVALLLLFADKEAGAEVYSAAADRDQARIVFTAAKQMVKASPDLDKRSQVYINSIVVPRTASSYKVLSADAPTKHGLNSHGLVVDEVHAQPNRELIDVLSTSTGSRRQPLEFYITTAGFDRNSICWELRDYAEKVRDGIIEDPSFLPVIYAADEKDDWKDPETWKKANPNLEVSIKLEYLERECKRAQEVPAYENTFKRLHLNIWTQQDVRWMPMDKWKECPSEIVEPEQLAGRVCYGGLDLSTKTDISSLQLVFPPADEEEPYKVLSYYWVPQDNIELRAKRDRVDYQTWVNQELIRPTEGNVVDYDVIRRDINELGEKFIVKEIAFDPWNATQLATQLMGDGFEMVPFRQGFASMTEPTKNLMALVLAKQINHGNNAVLTWMASNVAVEQDAAGNLKPSKKKSTEKIDGVVALIMAIGRAIVNPDSGSVYESRGVIAF
jgi:phage terminase large subunit-like protein